MKLWAKKNYKPLRKKKTIIHNFWYHKLIVNEGYKENHKDEKNIANKNLSFCYNKRKLPIKNKSYNSL